MNVPHYRLSVATASHKGDRAYQQDKVEVLQHPYEKNCFMVVVADGMGGRSGGAMAAQQVVPVHANGSHCLTSKKTILRPCCASLCRMHMP